MASINDNAPPNDAPPSPVLAGEGIAGEDIPALILTGEEMSQLGLKIFYQDDRIDRAGSESNIKRFQNMYGCRPTLAATIFEDLQKSADDASRVPIEKANPKYFLMSLHFLKCYPKEAESEGPFDLSKKTAREWYWYFIRKIQALKSNVITWPENNFQDLVWVITVDGTHCWIEEPIHPDWSQDSHWYSHKFNKAGVNYELGISIVSPRLVWMNGPYKAGTPDSKVFKRRGLKEKLASIHKKAIGDKGYNGHPDECSTFNVMDTRPVRKFKSRALHRHEYFNNMTKRFACLKGVFRHGAEKFASCFESVCVICQYQLDYGHDNLYDVLIEDIM